MYYKSEVEGVVRVDPSLFGEELDVAVYRQLKKDYEGTIIENLGRLIVVIEIKKIGDGIVIAGDGAAYYKTCFTAIHFIPEIHEIVEGEVRDIARFGAFINFGPFEGMIHISQTMNDIVSMSKQGTLLGRESKKALKKDDKVRARVIAISLQGTDETKIGLTMRQPYLGKLEWIEEVRKKEAQVAKKAAKGTSEQAPRASTKGGGVKKK